MGPRSIDRGIVARPARVDIPQPASMGPRSIDREIGCPFFLFFFQSPRVPAASASTQAHARGTSPAYSSPLTPHSPPFWPPRAAPAFSAPRHRSRLPSSRREDRVFPDLPLQNPRQQSRLRSEEHTS